MPEIVGPFSSVTTTMSSLDGHITHLRHLTNSRIAYDLLIDQFQFSKTQARESSKLICAHVGQSLEFHHQSRFSSITIRPVLQYYCYLNLAVAAILAYRPSNYNQYRRHGVEDLTHAIISLDLPSIVLRVQKGAVPLFHSIISDQSLYKKKFRFGNLTAGFHMVSHELATRFGKIIQAVEVNDQVKEISGSWYSEFSFTPFIDGKKGKISAQRIEDAMPLLSSDYKKLSSVDERIIYESVVKWTSEAEAKRIHKANGLRLINFGGHSAYPGGPLIQPECRYVWRGVSRVPLLPTLTSLILMAFSLASVSRYRPALLHQALGSPIHLIIDTFLQEADSIFIPSLRNLLYREETAVGSVYCI
ncbi:MAG: hypothetical protein GH155_04990 [Spirochaeta sp.]|nr:hypothetical protein [Spirochaeta sp.]